MTILAFRIEGVLQSWGERSRWNHRDTADMPTKSGIIGLLGCALGYPRGDARLPQLSESLVFAVRADRLGIMMTDYHTVQGQHEKIRNAEGKPRTNFDSNTIVTRREYLQDACFTVFLAGESALVQCCAAALVSPVWSPCLGRRSCPPTVPIRPLVTTEYASLDDAVQNFRWQYPVRKQMRMMTAQIEDPQGEHERIDIPVCACHYEFARRRVRFCTVKEG